MDRVCRSSSADERWLSRWLHRPRTLIALAVVGVLAPSLAHAVEIDEDRYGDAGSLPPSALPAAGSGPLNRIDGRLSSSAVLAGVDDFEDMYLIRIIDVAGFSARTVLREDEPPFDTQLWLFDACALGALGNDDDPERPNGIGFSILLPEANDESGFTLPGPGLYYLAVSGKARVPVSAAGPIFDIVDPTEISGPDGLGGTLPISDWIGDGPVGAYRIELTGCAFLGAGFGDIDGNDAVDGADLGALLNAWGSSDPATDLNGDGFVDGADLGALLNAWGPAPGPHFCGDDDAGDCFAANGTPYCDEVCCCSLVCALDPFCCDVEWDQLCADAAVVQCGGSSPANDLCDAAIPIGEGDTPFSTVGASTDGPPLPPECDEGFGLALVDDVWFVHLPACSGELTVGTCNLASFDTRLAIYVGSCADPLLIACNDDAPGCAGFTSLVSWPAVCGETYLIRVGGFGGGGDGTLSVTCDGRPCSVR